MEAASEVSGKRTSSMEGGFNDGRTARGSVGPSTMAIRSGLAISTGATGTYMRATSRRTT